MMDSFPSRDPLAPPSPCLTGRYPSSHARPSTGTPHSWCCNLGFTLVEMLVVLAIILVLSALVVPPVASLLRSLQITQAGNLISTQLDLARQLAVSKDLTIQVRLVVPSGSSYFSALALLKPTYPTPAVPSPTPSLVDKPTVLPGPIIMDSGSTLSSLTQPASASPLSTPTSSDPPLGSLGSSYSYIGFYFYPDGSTSLTPTSIWYVTLHNLTDGNNLTAPPKNYYTIQIDPSSGRITQYTP